MFYIELELMALCPHCRLVFDDEVRDNLEVPIDMGVMCAYAHPMWSPVTAALIMCYLKNALVPFSAMS